MVEAADQQEKGLEKEQAKKHQDGLDVIRTPSLIYDIGAAQHLHAELVETNPKLAEGLKSGDPYFVEQAHWDTNKSAIEALASYLEPASTQNSILGDFWVQIEELQRDGARLQAELTAYAATTQGQGTDKQSDTAEEAQAQIKSTGRTEPQLQAGFREAATKPGGSSNTAVYAKGSQDNKRNMEAASGTVIAAESEKIAAELKAKAAVEKLHTLILGHTIDADKEKIAELKEKADDAKEKIELIGGFVESATELATAPELAVGEVAKAAVGRVFDVAKYSAAHEYDKDIKDIKTKLMSLSDEKDNSELAAAVGEAEGAKRDYITAAQKHMNADKELSKLQADFRESMQAMGASADAATGGGDKYEVLAELLAEAEAFLARANAAIEIGKSEEAQSKKTAEEQEKLKGPNYQKIFHLPEGVPYYTVDRDWHFGQLSWRAVGPHYFQLHEGDDSGAGHAEGEEHGANPRVKKAMAAMKGLSEDIKKYADVLEKVFSTKAPGKAPTKGAE